ncbi:hypothetical protein Agub_g13652 [Astrephomene gubernaculifera]|uniref:Uncharacterized protein n=1 Tax=Astrephomene gubernaculifera TaxID=47775 RepID=A0AAD3HSH1_9CHLO|nr:hypothetical protein Agub_g13652 [Astrephomene gubernaculifera]
MPHAVVVGTDATALHVGGQLLASGFDVTLLEATQVIGGQWVRRLFAEKQDSAFNAWEDGVFLDYPLLAPRQGNAQRTSSCGVDNDLPASAVADLGNGPGPAPQQKPPPLPPPSEEELLGHLTGYAQATGLHTSVRLGCTLRRAKWQAMNGCWRLDVKQEQAYSRHMQRGNLSADLLVVSRLAVAAPRLPRVQGRELYCGTVLTANDQLSGSGGATILEQQLRGRHVLVVGATGCGAAAGWADACRRHAGAEGSVVLLEMDDPDAAPSAAAAGGAGGGLLGGLFGSCLGRTARSRTGGGGGSGGSGLERYSPALPAVVGEEVIADAATVDMELEEAGELLAVAGASTASTAMEVEVVAGVLAADGDGKGDRCTKASGVGSVGSGGDGGGRSSRGRDGLRQGRGGGGEMRSEGDSGGGGVGSGGGKGGPVGRSSLRVMRGTGALLNGSHVTFPSGEELPADVVLLVPLSDLEPSLSFLDCGPNLRSSQTGGPAPSLDGGSFHRGVSLSAASIGMSCAMHPDGLGGGAAGARQVEELYRDMVSTSPMAPNLAIVGAGAHAAQHDACTAAAQAAWLLETWVNNGDGTAAAAAPAAGAGAGGGGGALGGVGSSSMRRRRGSSAGGTGGWEGGGVGVPEAGYLRQATPVEAAADAALRARWRADAVARGQPDLYLQRYLGLLLSDLGAQIKDKQTLPSWLCGRRVARPAAQLLTRPRVARLLGVKRLRRQQPQPQHPQSPLTGAATWPTSMDGSVSRGQLQHRQQSYRHSHTTPAALSHNGLLLNDGSSAGNNNNNHNGANHQGFYGSRPSPSPTANMGLFGGSVGGGSVGSVAPSRIPSLGNLACNPSLTPNGMTPGVARRCSSYAGGGTPPVGTPGGVAEREQQRMLFPPPPSAPNGLQQQQSRGRRDVQEGMLRRSESVSAYHPGVGQQNNQHDAQQQLYRVAEHPTEERCGGGSGGGAEPHKAQSQSQLPQHNSGTLLTTCPSSPNGNAAAAAAGGAPTASSAFLTSGGTGGGGAVSTPTSPSPFMSTASAAGTGAGALVTAPVGGPDDSGGAPQRWRSQMLMRHRSTSRLAGVTGPTTPQASTLQGAGGASSGAASATASAIAMGSSFLGLSGSRRPPAASTSQVNLDISGSFSNELRSQGGRNSYGKRMGGTVSGAGSVGGGGGGGLSTGGGMAIGGGGGGSPLLGGGGSPLLGRANSAARLQLLLAAASSASRRRNTALAGSPSPSAAPSSPEPGRTSGGSGRMGSTAVPSLHKAYGNALRTPPAPAAVYGARQTRSHTSNAPAENGGGGDGGRSSGSIGTSVTALARAAAAPGAEGSRSEPVVAAAVAATAETEAPTSVALWSPGALYCPDAVYGKLSSFASSGGDGGGGGGGDKGVGGGLAARHLGPAAAAAADEVAARIARTAGTTGSSYGNANAVGMNEQDDGDEAVDELHVMIEEGEFPCTDGPTEGGADGREDEDALALQSPLLRGDPGGQQLPARKHAAYGARGRSYTLPNLRSSGGDALEQLEEGCEPEGIEPQPVGAC